MQQACATERYALHLAAQLELNLGPPYIVPGYGRCLSW